jgi:hypothetical protein
MRVARDRLIFLALCALDEIVDQAKDEPVKPSFGLRFTLAFLHALGDGKERGCYDGFWRCVTPQKEPHREHRLYYDYADGHLRGIAKSLGIDFEVQMRERINRARGLPPGHRSLKAKALERRGDRARGEGTGAASAVCDLERGGAVPKGQRTNTK